MPDEPLTLVRAGAHESAELLAQYQAIALGLQMRGIDQWQHYLGSEGPAMVQRRFREGEVHWICVGAAKAGFICVGFQDRLWGGWGQDARALYVTSMGVTRRYAGRGLGVQALDWAAGLAVAHGRGRLRLDTRADNAALCTYYETLGFIRIAGQERPDGALNLYERRLD
jgi:ribosomal protein S18 acetylase RimI-like enzyme